MARRKPDVNGFTCRRIFPERRRERQRNRPRANMIGEHGRIVADAGQEGGIHFRQPLQAEEIQAGHLGDAVAVNRFAAWHP